jgi:hypothetical protein
MSRDGAGEYLVRALAGVNLTLTLTLLAALVTRHRQQRPEPTESGSTQAMRSTCASRVLSRPTATRRPVRLNGDPTGADDDDDSRQQ